MKYFIPTTLVLLILLSVNLNAQQISSDSYNTNLIHEDFNQEGEHFKIITNTDNYFILDNGDYLLSRNNTTSEYAIIATNSLATDFVLKTLVRIGPSANKQASLGIILKAQQDEKGAIIFELNKKREYRIKQRIGDTYKTISGNNKGEGWVRNKIINSVDEHNLIEIRTEDNIYDVYINNKHLTTFFIDYHTSGTCGLIISPATKVRISYYYLNTKEESNPEVSYIAKNTESINTTAENVNNKIATLEADNSKLNTLNNQNQENQEVKISNLKNKNTALSIEIKQLKIQATKITDENTDLAVSNTQKDKTITKLNRIIFELRNNTDKVDELEMTNQLNTTSISNLKNNNTALSKETEQLKSKINNIKAKNTELAAILSQEVEQLKSKANNIKAKNTKLASTTIEQEQKIKSLTTINKDLKNSSNEITTKNQQLNKKISSLKQDISLEKSINQELKQEVSLEKSINQELKNDLDKDQKLFNRQITQLNTEVKTLKSEASKLSKEKNGLSTAVKSKTTEVKKLSSKLKNTNNEINTLKVTQAKHDKVTNNLNTQITDLNNKVDLLNNQLNIRNNDVATLQATNAEIKELFILKDFELNGIKPSEMAKQTSNTPPAPKLLRNTNTFYTIQLGVFMKEQVNTSIRSLDSFWYTTTDNGTYIYYSGEFNSPQEAAAYKNKVATLGYPDAFVTTLTK